MRSNDTIVAIATPAGVGGIAVVRLSGPEALPLALRHLDVEQLRPRHATYCRFDDLDDGVAVYYPAGYTGEPTVEFSCHGSQYLQQAIVQTLADSGARMAEAGEFTMRAFLNGRLNLSQAEAVADLVDAATPAQHRLAVSQLRGGYAQKLKEMRSQLVDLASMLELELDFSQEDVEFADRRQLHGLLDKLSSMLASLIDSFATGNAIKAGVPVVLVGRPNAGKSTLLNALLHDDRAIVSPIPGTTRDTIEEMLTLDGITFRLTDTAGLHDTDDELEIQGMLRTRKACEEAYIVVEVWDATLPLDYMSDTVHDDGKHHIRVINKCDKAESAWAVDGQQRGDTRFVALSALDGRGVDSLQRALTEAVGQRQLQEVMLSNPRHRDALVRVRHAVERVQEGLDRGVPTDLVAVDMRDALYHLGTITGEVATEDILTNIFSHFCIGK